MVPEEAKRVLFSGVGEGISGLSGSYSVAGEPGCHSVPETARKLVLQALKFDEVVPTKPSTFSDQVTPAPISPSGG